MDVYFFLKLLFKKKHTINVHSIRWFSHFQSRHTAKKSRVCILKWTNPLIKNISFSHHLSILSECDWLLCVLSITTSQTWSMASHDQCLTIKYIYTLIQAQSAYDVTVNKMGSFRRNKTKCSDLGGILFKGAARPKFAISEICNRTIFD